MPSATSIPDGRVVSSRRWSASHASSASPARVVASISSGNPHIETHGSKVFEVACRAADAACS
jgi:hypothetical protein